jgi:NitT/TauT family transport system ATP-binding protein
MIVLPDCGLSRIVGLLEIVHDNKDQVNFMELAKDLDLEIEYLLPPLTAAELLGFLGVSAGTISLTKKGVQVVNAGILKRKEIVREAVRELDLFKKVLSLLKAKKRVPRKQLHRVLRADLGEKETEITLQRLTDWGRYSELLGFDSNTQEYFLMPLGARERI